MARRRRSAAALTDTATERIQEEEPDVLHVAEELAAVRPADHPINKENWKFRIRGTSIYLQMVRKTEEKRSPEVGSKRMIVDQVGHTVVLTHEAFAVTHYFKYRRKEGTLQVFVDEGEGPKEVAAYERGWETE